MFGQHFELVLNKSVDQSIPMAFIYICRCKCDILSCAYEQLCHYVIVSCYMDHCVLNKTFIYLLIYSSTSVTNWGMPASTGVRRDRRRLIRVSQENRHNPVMVNDLMIRYISVHNYNKNRSQPVMIECIHTWVGAPVDRRRLTGMVCPNRTLISVRIIGDWPQPVPFIEFQL